MKKLFIVFMLIATCSHAARSLLPTADGVGDLGSPSMRWGSIHAYSNLYTVVVTQYVNITNIYVSNIVTYTTNYVTNYTGILNGSNILNGTVGSNKLDAATILWLSSLVGLTNVETVATNYSYITNQILYIGTNLFGGGSGGGISGLEVTNIVYASTRYPVNVPYSTNIVIPETNYVTLTLTGAVSLTFPTVDTNVLRWIYFNIRSYTNPVTFPAGVSNTASIYWRTNTQDSVTSFMAIQNFGVPYYTIQGY